MNILSRLPLRLPTALLGVACLFAVQFVCFLEGRGLGVISFPLPEITAAFFMGILCGGFFYSSRFAKTSGPLVALLLTATSGFLWGFAILEENEVACYGACFLGAAILPPALTRLISASTSPGLHLGSALAAGDFFWLFLYLLPTPLDTSTLGWLLLAIQAIGGVMVTLCLLTSGHEKPSSPSTTDPLVWETSCYLTIITLLFFLFNAFIDIAFYRVHDNAFPIPALVHLYIWMIYPLVGLFIDRRGTDMRLLLVCLGGSIVSPALVAVSEGTLLYWIIYMVALSSRGAALLYLLLVFAQLRERFAYPELLVSIPYLGMFGTFMLAYLFVEHFPGTLHIALWGLFLMAGFSYISSRIQYALTLSGIAGFAKQEKKQPASVDYGPETFAQFSGKYGLSTREQDVLRLIVEGCDTTKIGETLHISENTIKTHVRQLLRKTKTRNRIALAALFFNEARTPELS